MESSHHRRSARLNALAALSLVLVMGSQVPRAWGGTGIIITVAGGGSVGDGGQATGAQLFLPMGATVDATGNLFIADTAHHRIRRVTAGTGIITTVAGTGAMGFSGDGGPAPSAQLNSPIGVAIDAAGNLFIADASNHRIRRVAAGTGIITTVAGTGAMGFSGDDVLATSAQLNSPIGVAVDAAGDLFIADAYNHRIRRVAVSTGIITTVAGTGESGFSGDGGPATSAQVDTPAGVAIDAAGNLLIADTNNQRVRQVAGSTITTVAGTGESGFSGDGDLATSAQLSVPYSVTVDAAGNLLIADVNNSRIRQVAASTGLIATVAGTGEPGFSGDGGAATRAQLWTPTGVAVDAVGNLFIADADNHRIRRVAAGTGLITTVAGTGIPGFSDDGSPATRSHLSNPTGIAIDVAGNLFIADTESHRIRRVAVGTARITTIAGTGIPGFSGDGGPATDAVLWTPTGVAVDAVGNLFIADADNHRIRRVEAGTGIITTVAGTGTPGFSGDGDLAASAQLSTPTGVAVDATGNVFIADADNHRIRRVAAGTGIITTVAGTGVAGFSGDEGPATGSLLNFPYYVAVDAVGNLFIADQGNFRIRRVAAGIITTVAGTGIPGFSGDGGPAISAQLSVPYGVATDGAGDLFIADTSNNRVRAVDLAVAVPPPVITSKPANPTDDTSATFYFVGAGSGVVLFSCQLDGGGFTPCLSPQSYSGPLTFGEHTFQVRAIDQFGDTSAPSTYIWRTTTPVFALTVAKQGTGSSSVTSSPEGISCGSTCSANYLAGTLVTLTATPDAGSIFIGWSGESCSGADTCTVTIATTTAVTANFIRMVALSVTVTGTGSGTVTSSPPGISCGATCTASFVSGTVVTLTATPDVNSAFTGWSGGCTGSEGCVVAVSAATTVTATFAPVFTLTVSPVAAGAGTVTSTPAGISCGVTCTASFVSRTVVTLTATPGANWVFRGWSGGCTGSEGCVVTVSAATTVTATFAQVFALTVSTVGAGAGMVTSTPAGISCGATCAASFVGGTVVTLTATPDGGSAFGGWSGGSCSGTGPCTLSLGAPTVITATFNVTGPFTFSDPNLVGRVSTIKAVHIEELRSAINTARTNRGLDAFRFTDQNLMIERTTVEAVHIAELRAALDEVYDAVRAPAPTYTDPTLGVRTTVMKAVHIRELRSAVQTVPSFPE